MLAIIFEMFSFPFYSLREKWEKCFFFEKRKGPGYFLFLNHCFKECSIDSYFLDKLKPGCYAVSVSGQLPHHVIRDLKMKGIQYKSRDVSSRT